MIRREKDKTKERRTVLTNNGPIHDSYKANSKDKNNITLLSVNTHSLSHWSQEINKVERFKHIFNTVTHVQDFGPDTLKVGSKHMYRLLCVNKRRIGINGEFRLPAGPLN